jgi:hypothetical protein
MDMNMMKGEGKIYGQTHTEGVHYYIPFILKN